MSVSCIYHFSAKPDSKVCSKHIEEIRQFADLQNKHIDYVYIDGSLKQGEKIEYLKMMKEAENFEHLFVRDLFHLNKWTLKALADVKTLKEKGVSVSSMQSGEIVLECGHIELVKPKKVLFYHSKVSKADERRFETQQEIVNLFCREKTKWIIADTVYDESAKKFVEAQPNLWKMGDLSSRYDQIIVQSFARLDLSAARFEKIIKQLNIDIYSMQEGYLKVRKEQVHGT